MKFKTKLISYAIFIVTLYILYRIYGKDVASALRKHYFVGIILPACILLVAFYLWIKHHTHRRHQNSSRKKSTSPLPSGKDCIPKGSFLIIDTNVWMNSSLSSWFTKLRKKATACKWTIHVESIVLGELKGLTKNTDKARDAHTGMKRIEELQMTLSANFRMEDHANRKSDHSADEVLVRYAKNHKKSILITDDRELRIMAREQGVTTMRPADCRF